MMLLHKHCLMLIGTSQEITSMLQYNFVFLINHPIMNSIFPFKRVRKIESVSQDYQSSQVSICIEVQHIYNVSCPGVIENDCIISTSKVYPISWTTIADANNSFNSL